MRLSSTQYEVDSRINESSEHWIPHMGGTRLTGPGRSMIHPAEGNIGKKVLVFAPGPRVFLTYFVIVQVRRVLIEVFKMSAEDRKSRSTKSFVHPTNSTSTEQKGHILETYFHALVVPFHVLWVCQKTVQIWRVHFVLEWPCREKRGEQNFERREKIWDVWPQSLAKDEDIDQELFEETGQKYCFQSFHVRSLHFQVCDYCDNPFNRDWNAQWLSVWIEKTSPKVTFAQTSQSLANKWEPFLAKDKWFFISIFMLLQV